MFASRFPVNELSETLHDSHGDAGVTVRGLPANDACGLSEVLEVAYASEMPLSDEELDLLAARDHACRQGLHVFKLSCKGFPSTYEAGATPRDAWRQAIGRGWANGGGAVNVRLAESYNKPAAA